MREIEELIGIIAAYKAGDLFGCKHEWLNTVPRTSRDFIYSTVDIEDWFCNRCWIIMDNKEYNQSIRDEKPKDLGI